MSVLSTPTGHLTNLSTVPRSTETGEDGTTTTHRIGLFPSAGDLALGRHARLCAHHQPLRVGRRWVRIARRRRSARAYDERHRGGGARSTDADYRCGRTSTVHINSGRRSGDGQLAGWGTRGALDGEATGAHRGEGDWRLTALEHPGDVEVLSYIRTERARHRRLPDQHARLRAAHRGGASGGDVQSGQQRQPQAASEGSAAEGVNGGGRGAARRCGAAHRGRRRQGGVRRARWSDAFAGGRGVAHGQRQGPGVRRIEAFDRRRGAGRSGHAGHWCARDRALQLRGLGVGQCRQGVVGRGRVGHGGLEVESELDPRAADAGLHSH